MNFATPKASHNRLLSLLPPAELERLRPHLVRAGLVNGQTLHEAGEHIGQVFFVGRGYVSMVSEADGDDGGTEVGLIGRESMVGLPTLLGPGAASFSRAMVQSPGEALRLPAQVLHDNAQGLPVLRRLLSQALEVLMAQTAQTAACNSRHTLAQRLARWLLMAHDQVDGDELAMTQEFLSIMLAVRRSGVTVASQALIAAGAIRTGRGRVTVCDRPALEAAACGCYGRVKAFTEAVDGRTSDLLGWNMHAIARCKHLPHASKSPVLSR